MGKTAPTFTLDAIKELQKYRWTGNIRELHNVIERLVILCGNEVDGDDVRKYVQPLVS
jgi:DNA-binding NtrC family response regulator